jgi:hypothetical protein
MDPDRREQDCDSAEDKHQRHPELLTADRSGHEIGHALELDSNLRIEPADLVTNRGLKGCHVGER